MKCKHCGEEIPNDCVYCELCGTRQKPGSFIDIGLPSGTLWKDKNECGGFYTYIEAVNRFEDGLPTKEQMKELKDKCRWTWTDDGYRVTGPNGNTIVLSGEGGLDCYGSVLGQGTCGYYLSSAPDDSDHAWYLYFDLDNVGIDNIGRCCGGSVRLVAH